MNEVSIACGICPGVIRLGDVTCPSCGRQVDERDRAVLQVRLEGGNYIAGDRGTVMRSASKWIAALAIIFAISSAIGYFMSATQADKALARLEEFEPNEVLAPIDGKTYTAGELRQKVKQEPMRILIVSLVLAGLLGALWVWSRRSPLPAIICAFALLVVLWGAEAVSNPVSIFHGIILKILSLAVLYKGLRAALAARAAMRRPTT